eukprot:sb/3470466/
MYLRVRFENKEDPVWRRHTPFDKWRKNRTIITSHCYKKPFTQSVSKVTKGCYCGRHTADQDRVHGRKDDNGFNICLYSYSKVIYSFDHMTENTGKRADLLECPGSGITFRSIISFFDPKSTSYYWPRKIGVRFENKEDPVWRRHTPFDKWRKNRTIIGSHCYKKPFTHPNLSGRQYAQIGSAAPDREDRDVSLSRVPACKIFPR